MNSLCRQVGAGFEIEFMESAKTVGDVHLDAGSGGGLAVGGGDTQFERARSDAAVDRGNRCAGGVCFDCAAVVVKVRQS